MNTAIFKRLVFFPSKLSHLLLFVLGHSFKMRKFLISKDTAKASMAVKTSTSETASPIVSKVMDTVVTETSKVSVEQKFIGLSSSSTTISVSHTETVAFLDRVKEISIPEQYKRHISWQSGEPIPYSVVVNVFEEISKVSGRLDKENMLSRLFSCVLLTTPSNLESIVYLASNKVYPTYDGLDLGVGDSLLVKAICEATGRKKDAVEEAYEKEGDLGVVASASRASQKTLSFAAKSKPLTAEQVLEQFRTITKIKGDKAQGRKVDAIKSLLVKGQGEEAKYIVRAMQGKLRIGLAEQTVLVALAHAIIDHQALLFPTSTSTSTSTSFVSNHHQSASDDDDLVDSDEEIVPEKKRVSAEKTTVRERAERESKGAVISAEEEADEAIDLSSLLQRVEDRETPEARRLRLHYAGAEQRCALSREKLYESAEIAVKRAFSECPNLSLLVQALLSSPIYELYKRCRLMIGVPVIPMLAKPSKEIGDVLKRLAGQAFTMEYKYDGERAQVHLLADGTVKIFSRNSEDNTNKYLELGDVIKQGKREAVRSCIVDAEVVAYDREKGVLLPFQVLSTRKRKAEPLEEQKVKIVLQIFDLLYINDKSLLRESLRTRRALLRKAFIPQEQFLYFAAGGDHVEDGDTLPIEALLNEACANSCEGLMVKTLDDNATYEPSKRSLNWLKLKKDYIQGMGVCDSVDLVPIGGYLGRGKRTNVYGAYLMAVYDPDRDEFQSVCKVGTGFKDEDLQRLTEKMRAQVIPSSKKPVNYNVGDALTPDDWFVAGNIVWEMQAADLSRSSVHRAGVGRIDSDAQDNSIRGIGLRFPRFLRDREDKKAEQATTSEQIVEMFLSQGGVNANANADRNDEEDDDWI